MADRPWADLARIARGHQGRFHAEVVNLKPSQLAGFELAAPEPQHKREICVA